MAWHLLLTMVPQPHHRRPVCASTPCRYRKPTANTLVAAVALTFSKVAPAAAWLALTEEVCLLWACGSGMAWMRILVSCDGVGAPWSEANARPFIIDIPRCRVLGIPAG